MNEEKLKGFLFILGMNMVLLSLFLIDEPSKTYWNLYSETTSAFWLIWRLLQTFYPIIIFCELIFFGLYFIPIKYNPLVYSLDKCFPGLKEALKGDIKKANEIFYKEQKISEIEQNGNQ